MERSTVEAEEGHLRSNSSASVSKSSGSIVRIDSISIDLGVAIQKNEDGKCQHFSIRGYVAEMREKNKNSCMPFALEAENNMSEEQKCMLPPLYVAKFRWWRCENCLREICGANASEVIHAISRCCKSALMAGGTSTETPSLDHASDAMAMQEALKPENSEGKKGHGIGSEDNSKQVVSNSTSGTIEPNLLLSQEKHPDDKVFPKSNSTELADACEPKIGSHDHADIHSGTDQTKLMENVSNSADKCIKIITNPADDRPKNVLEVSKEVVKPNEKMDADKCQPVRLPSLELKLLDNVSYDTGEILATKALNDQHQDGCSSLLRRRTKKMRLLKDLLGNKGNKENCQNLECSRTHASAGLPSVSVPPCQVALGENAENSIKIIHRKRKMPQELNVVQKVKNFNDNQETVSVTISISDSDAEEGAFSGVSGASLKSGKMVKSHCRIDGSRVGAVPTKRKNKPSQLDNGYLPLVACQEVVPSTHHLRIGNAEGFSKSKFDAFTGRGMESCFKSYVSPDQSDRELMLLKMKNKVPQVQGGEASSMSRRYSSFGEASLKRKNVEFMMAGSQITDLQSASDVCSNIKLDLSLNSYMDMQRNERDNISKLEDKVDLSLHLPKGFPGKAVRRTDDTCIGESSMLRYSGPDASLTKGFPCDLNETFPHGSDVACEQQNSFPLLGDGSSVHRKLDLSGPCKSDNIAEVQGQAEVLWKHIGQQGDQVFEQGTLDDVPMEIVELMARNQFERGLGGTNNKRNAEIMGFPKVHEDEVVRPLQKEFPFMRKFSSGSVRDGVNTPVQNPGSAKRNTFDLSHVTHNYFNACQRDHENSAFRLYSAFPQSQQKQSHTIRYGNTQNHQNQQKQSHTIRYGNSQNHEWDGDKMLHRFSPNNMQVLEAYNSWHTGSQYNGEGERVWSSGAPNNIPFGLGISQKYATQSSYPGIHAQCSDPLHKGKIIRDLDLNSINPDATNLEKQNENFNFDPLKRTASEYPFVLKQRGIEINPMAMGTVDPYSNETIPAMQLLSLMDGGTTPFNVDAKKFLEKPFAPCGYHPKFSTNEKQNFLYPYHHYSTELSVVGPGECKAIDGSKLPSSSLTVKSHMLEKPCECLPPVPGIEPHASSSQVDGNYRSIPVFTNQTRLKSQGKEKTKRSFSSTQNRGRRSQKSASTSGVQFATRGCNPTKYKQKEKLGASDSFAFPLQSQQFGKSYKGINLETHKMHGTVWPLQNIPKTDICIVNRNPADFTIPGAENEYMIGGENLKLRKKFCKNRSGYGHVDGRKRQRNANVAMVQENKQHKA